MWVQQKEQQNIKVIYDATKFIKNISKDNHF